MVLLAWVLMWISISGRIRFAVIKTAVIYGADAVYLGGEAFGLRAKAKNFTNEEIREGIAFAHERGVKVYITANIFAHNDDLPGVEEYFKSCGRSARTL